MNPTCTFLSLVLLAFCLLTANTNHVSAQEPAVADDSIDQEERKAPDDSEDADDSEDSEERGESAIEIREAEKQRDQLRERLGFLDKRVQLLKQRQGLERKQSGLERQIETAEERGIDPDEDLEEQWERTEFELEKVTIRLELITKRLELSELRQSFSEENLDTGNRDFKEINTAFTEAEKLTRQFFESVEAGDDHRVEQVEIRLGELEHEYEVRTELLQLRLELHFAEEEGEEEWIRELKSELRELARELGREEESTDQSRNVNIDDERISGVMAKPVEVDDATLSAVVNMNYREHIEPMLERHCHECHSEGAASGDLNLMSLAADTPWVVNRSTWLNISQQIKMRTMPPPEGDPMPDADRLIIAAFLKHRIEDFDYETVRQPGYEPVRRLTNQEYNHTIRDLFGIDIRPADRFPRELTASSGFANSANSLFLQPVILERYLGAAEQVIATAMPTQAETQQARDTREMLVGSGSAVEAITNFARRAFRRPVRPQELQSLLDYYSELTGQPANSVNHNDISYKALGKVFEAVLASPSFLLRHEGNQGKAIGESFRITDHELASRLSYFLWATMPDARLSRIADAGNLHDPRVLAAEVDRMLADPKSETLGTIFASQWLGFSALPHAPRDPIDNPWATDSLVDAMQQESALFFSSLVQENLAMERLIDAKYTFVNEELARHYGIDGIRGSDMQRVSLDTTSRSGILGHGSILAITSFPNRTSPVVRGNWILTELLGTPPPPPPPNVSEFDERVAERRNLSQRQKLELHRNNPNCYACHAQIDPLGFALEDYDWFGRHRGSHRGRQTDTRGILPGGTEFRGLKGMQTALIDERTGQLVEQITRKMMTYALGRQLEYFDEPVIRDIIKQVESDGRRFQSLIHAIVKSETFQMKQRLP